MNNKNLIGHSLRMRGVTLIELMITVAIIGILAAIVYPSYRQYLVQTNRTEGMAALQQAAVRQERYFSNNSTYANTMNLAAANIADETERGHYAITAVACAGGTIATCYVMTATAQGGQTDDAGCTTLTLDSTGDKSPDACW
jgi:type IV pilus assembly protein PilE